MSAITQHVAKNTNDLFTFNDQSGKEYGFDLTTLKGKRRFVAIASHLVNNSPKVGKALLKIIRNDEKEYTHNASGKLCVKKFEYKLLFGLNNSLR